MALPRPLTDANGQTRAALERRLRISSPDPAQLRGELDQRGLKVCGGAVLLEPRHPGRCGPGADVMNSGLNG